MNSSWTQIVRRRVTLPGTDGRPQTRTLSFAYLPGLDEWRSTEACVAVRAIGVRDGVIHRRALSLPSARAGRPDEGPVDPGALTITLGGRPALPARVPEVDPDRAYAAVAWIEALAPTGDPSHDQADLPMSDLLIVPSSSSVPAKRFNPRNVPPARVSARAEEVPRISSAQLDRTDFLRLVTGIDLTRLAESIEAGRFEALLPGIRAEMDIPQRTRWHALSVLRHSAATAELLPADPESRVTGFFHDLGKRASAGPNRRGEESYLGHAERGAEMVQSYLLALGFSPEERTRMTRRIAHHMDLHQAGRDAVTARSLDKVLDKLGVDLGFLSDLAVADTASMHPTIATAKLAEHTALAWRLAGRATERGLPTWTRTNADAVPHPAAAAAVLAGRAYIPVALSPAEQAAADAAKAREVAAADRALLVALGVTPSTRSVRPSLLLVAGLPASGKSHLARALTRRVPSLARLSSDSVRMNLTDGDPVYSGPESYKVFATIGRLASYLLTEGYSVLIDATGVRPRDRRSSLEVAAVVGCPSLIAWCEVDEPTAADRLARRARGEDQLDHSQADVSVRDRMAALTTPPRPEEAGLIVRVTPATFESALEQLVSALQ